MILSVDDLDDFHESFMIKLEHDNFSNVLLSSDVQEIKQAVERRKQQWKQLEQVFTIIYNACPVTIWIRFLSKRYIITFEPEKKVRFKLSFRTTTKLIFEN